jgi:hypothetical protein
VDDVYTRLETFQDSKKLIRDATSSARSDRSDNNNNNNSKPTTGMSFNQDGNDSSKNDSSDEQKTSWSKDKKCFKCERIGYITKFCNYTKKENGDAINTNEQR